VTTMRNLGAALISWAAAAHAVPVQAAAGEVYEVSLEYQTSSETSDQSSSSSNGRDTLIERVIEVTPEGLALEYDAPAEPELPHGRQDQWQFPVRVFKPLEGPMRLLNSAELEARIEQWLEHTETPRSACGTWYFTWNAFQIECDPQSVIETLERFDLRPARLSDGAMLDDPIALAPSPLVAAADGRSYVVEMYIDPDAVHRERAQSDVIVAEIMGKPVTFEDALNVRAAEDVSGTITITFAVDAAGNVRRRTRVTKLETRQSDGVVESSTATVAVERHLLSLAD
jgi:hypothetical protein